MGLVGSLFAALFARPRLLGAGLAVLLVCYALLMSFNRGRKVEVDRQNAAEAKAITDGVSTVREAEKDITVTPVDDLMRKNGWLRD